MTPIPWHTNEPLHYGKTEIHGADGSTVGTVYDGMKDAPFIVKACNAHGALVGALQAVAARLRGDRAVFEALGYLWTDSEMDDTLDAARSALGGL